MQKEATGIKATNLQNLQLAEGMFSYLSKVLQLQGSLPIPHFINEEDETQKREVSPYHRVSNRTWTLNFGPTPGSQEQREAATEVLLLTSDEQNHSASSDL